MSTNNENQVRIERDLFLLAAGIILQELANSSLRIIDFTSVAFDAKEEEIILYNGDEQVANYPY